MSTHHKAQHINTRRMAAEDEEWALVAAQAAELNREMDAALADISTMRSQMARHRPYSTARQALEQLRSLAPAITQLPALVCRTKSSSKELHMVDHCARLLHELREAGTGALDRMDGVLLLEMDPRTRKCAHFGTVRSGSVHPISSTLTSKAATTELVTSKIRRYSGALARHAAAVLASDVPIVITRILRHRCGQHPEHVCDIVAMRKQSNSKRRVPKWLRTVRSVPDVREQEIKHEEEEMVCAVCLESGMEFSCVALGCGHKFHQLCIKKWIEKFYRSEAGKCEPSFNSNQDSSEVNAPGCPLCRQPIRQIPQS